MFLIKEMVDETVVTNADGLHTLELVVHLGGDLDDRA